MKKKKMMALLLSTAMVLSMAACGSSGSSSSEDTAAETTEETEEEASEEDSTEEAADAEEKAMYDGEVIIGQANWVGYAPLYLADQLDLFEDYGANVTIQYFESKTDSKSALAAGRIQGVATSLDTNIMSAASGVDLSIVLMLDTSAGGDGLIAKNEIGSIEELAGKKVGLDTSGGASYFWFQYLLNQHGMTLDDVEAVNMSSGDAGAAFIAGELDAAVTWEPWLTNARNTDFGTVLIDSSETPGIIIDALGMDSEFCAEYPGTVEAICKGWYAALEYMETNPDEAYDIMIGFTGNETGDELKETMEAEVAFYDQAANIDYFENDLDEISQMISDLWYENGLIEEKPDLASILDGSFLGTVEE